MQERVAVISLPGCRKELSAQPLGRRPVDPHLDLDHRRRVLGPAAEEANSQQQRVGTGLLSAVRTASHVRALAGRLLTLDKRLWSLLSGSLAALVECEARERGFAQFGVGLNSHPTTRALLSYHLFASLVRRAVSERR